MNIKELNNIIEGVLNQETKKLIIEQISKTNKMIDTIKNFQTLYGMSDKISNVEEIDDGFIVNIKDIKPEELVDCCGGTSLSDAQKNLIQGLHHDLEENGMGNNFDIDIDKIENKLIDLKVKNLFDALGWSTPTQQSTFNDSIFEY